MKCDLYGDTVDTVCVLMTGGVCVFQGCEEGPVCSLCSP